MGTEMLLGIGMVILGAVLLAMDFLAFVKKKLTEGFALLWGVLAVLFLTAGCLLVGKRSVTVILVLLSVVLLFSLFALSRAVSVLTMKNQELAMQVSLLNQENESVLQALGQLGETDENE